LTTRRVELLFRFVTPVSKRGHGALNYGTLPIHIQQSALLHFCKPLLGQMNALG
jgi:hypothetical protein